MKYYFIFTQEIHSVGGMQLYTAGKAKFLEDRGWVTIVIHPDFGLHGCAYSYLDRYTKYAFPVVEIPPVAYGKNSIEKILNQFVKGMRFTDEDVIYIESHYDIAALWAELLAEKLNAKHICFNCNEIFRGGHKIYEYTLDYFWFKYERHELLGLRPDTVCKIFQDYKDIEPDISTLFDAVEPNPIQDVYDSRIEMIKDADYTIMYLGRIVKGYVPGIIEGVAQFAKKHSDKQVQFCIVGDPTERKDYITNTLLGIDNLILVLLGDMVPIPRELYNHVDVVIAGAVCAEISARCGVPTIVADCENYLANGVLGYTVQNSMYFEEYGQTSYLEALENTLIEEEYKKYEYIFPDAIPEDEIYEEHMQFFKMYECEEEYYPIAQVGIPINYSRIKMYLLVKNIFANIKK